jgi:hypothetical protein
VKIAPDGSLIVADWYDPGVGGHAMGDLERGRLFRVTAAGGSSRYRVPTFDFTTAAGAVAALKNPNYAVRYLAWTALHGLGAAAEAELGQLLASDNPRLRARAVWLLARIPGREQHYIQAASRDPDPNVRLVALRLARQSASIDLIPIVSSLADDDAPQVRRECALALRHRGPEVAELWARLAARHDGRDRWYLEALGIGADRQWDACLSAWLARVGEQWNTPSGRDIIWRSRAAMTATYLGRIIADPHISVAELPRYFRAFDFLREQPRTRQ